MEAVFEPTLNMINQDFAEFPEHRMGLFRLLRAINLHCFPGKDGLQCYKFFLCSCKRSIINHSSNPIQIVHGQYNLGYQAHHA